MGVACGPGYTLIRLQALRSLAGIRYYPTHLSEPGFMRFNGLQDLNNQDEKSRKSKKSYKSRFRQNPKSLHCHP